VADRPRYTPAELAQHLRQTRLRVLAEHRSPHKETLGERSSWIARIKTSDEHDQGDAIGDNRGAFNLGNGCRWRRSRHTAGG
jgi:hypothetical protein